MTKPPRTHGRRRSARLAAVVLVAFASPVSAQGPAREPAGLPRPGGPGLAAPQPAAPPLQVPASPAASQPVDVVLEDQFRNRRATADLRGDVVVLVYAARHGAEAALDIGRRLHLRFHPTADGAEVEAWSTQPVVQPAGWPAGVRVPDVHVVPIACVPEVPRPLHAVARTRLRQESPHVSVWLDFDDVMRQRFGMVPDEPNVAVIDTRGVVHGVRSGHVDAALFEDLVRVVDRLRVASLSGLRTAAVPPSVIPAGSAVPGVAPAAGGVVPAGGIR